jgi:hypothetical protein
LTAADFEIVLKEYWAHPAAIGRYPVNASDTLIRNLKELCQLFSLPYALDSSQ